MTTIPSQSFAASRKSRTAIILDLKKSGVSKRTRKTHRVVLPRLSDLVHDLLDLLATREPHQSVEVFVLDFTDAFWPQQSGVILLGLMAKIIGNTGVQLRVPVMAHFLGQVLRLYS